MYCSVWSVLNTFSNPVLMKWLRSMKLVARIKFEWIGIFMHGSIFAVTIPTGFTYFLLLNCISPRAHRKRLFPSLGTTLTSNSNLAYRSKLKRQIFHKMGEGLLRTRISSFIILVLNMADIRSMPKSTEKSYKQCYKWLHWLDATW